MDDSNFAVSHLTSSRPVWLRENIDASFTLASSASFRGYLILSTPDYNIGGISATEALQFLQKPGRICRVLDIGAGRGNFLRRLRDRFSIEGVGICAQQYCAAPVGVDLRCVNAEHMLSDSRFAKEEQAGRLYDLIVSHETFRHLQDPIGTLCQAHRLLAPGGILMIDKMHVRGCSPTTLLAWWHRMGHRVFGEAEGEKLGPLFVCKKCPEETLNTTLFYSNSQYDASGHETVYRYAQNHDTETTNTVTTVPPHLLQFCRISRRRKTRRNRCVIGAAAIALLMLVARHFSIE